MERQHFSHTSIPRRWRWHRLLQLLVLASHEAARGQQPPAFSLPGDPPPDLQVDGEWWFYRLLDSEFPHTILELLPPTAVVPGAMPSQGLFRELPNAEHVLLEFFAPWCPHCKHFAPEMVKLVSALQGASYCGQDGACRPLVAIRSVDCERLEMKPACEWGAAVAMPLLLVAPRETLLGALGATAEQTPGVKTLFPVSEATEAMAWLQQQVPNWPQNLPAVAPADKNVPFFGWAQPVGPEPPQVPLQDLDVATASLLHEAFSTPLSRPGTREALLDLLGLLCAAGPGGDVCQMSACNMQQALAQEWDTLVRQKVVTTSQSGEAISPFTVQYLDWARIEHEHRWCDRPWPEYAQEGWSWCRGQTPGSRGFTCGLWLLLHRLMVGAASASAAQGGCLAALSSPPLEVVRNTIRHFFGCQDCQSHFLAVPVAGADLASPQAQALWLWRTHNGVTARIAEEDRAHSASAPPRPQWPAPATCPQCYSPDGMFYEPEIFNFLLRFYGTGAAAAAAGVMAAAPGAVGQAGPLANIRSRLDGLVNRLTGKYELARATESTPHAAQAPPRLHLAAGALLLVVTAGALAWRTMRDSFRDGRTLLQQDATELHGGLALLQPEATELSAVLQQH